MLQYSMRPYTYQLLCNAGDEHGLEPFAVVRRINCEFRKY
jgi:hypothetical protein